VSPPPKAHTGIVTFGYLGRAIKTSERVWALWAEILHRVPRSRLVFKGREYADHALRTRLLEFFASLRISSSRLDFQGATPRGHHLASYGQIDVALDTFPQGGGITTLEACLMGVPSVTLLGDDINGRTSASVLATIGRKDWIAVDPEHYVTIATVLAQTPTTLADRRGLRDALLTSIICDPPAYAAAVERVYREAWAAWCSQQATRPALALVGSA
jgi:predicted O-linked N-acetylglucosamine transferase (SPINDLY family)